MVNQMIGKHFPFLFKDILKLDLNYLTVIQVKGIRVFSFMITVLFCISIML